MPVTNYIWDEENDTLLTETDEDGNTIAEYTHEPGRYGPLISQRRNGHTYYYHYDGQGSTRALTDESGNVTDRYTYTAFGEPVASSGTTTNPFGYKGALGYYANPETNDLYVRARRYVPPIGRWLSVDPFLLTMSQSAPVHAQQRHGYQYADNSPVVRSDASGLTTGACSCCGVDESKLKRGKCDFFKHPRLGLVYTQWHRAEYVFRKSRYSPFVQTWPFLCECCEFRQYLAGFFLDYYHVDAETGEEKAVWFTQQDAFREDTGPAGTPYGHRDCPSSPDDVYSEPDRQTGCRYKMVDVPGFWRLEKQLQLSILRGWYVRLTIRGTFILEIIQAIENSKCCRKTHLKDLKIFGVNCDSGVLKKVPAPEATPPFPLED
jgi:RHS repeat-associated protein